ncbi:unnamed protein product [Ectocarpus sp. 4 AP-2014]
MASSGRGNTSLASMRKKRRTIGGFRAHAMGDSYDHSTTADASANNSLSMVPENQLSCLAGGDSGSENIVVAVRVRPLSAIELAEGKRSCCDVLTRNTLIIRKGADPGAYLRSQKGSANEYSFDAVFPPDAGQSEVYEGTAKPHISELLEGINVTVFAYGATGAGKTHTMMGSERVVGVRAGDEPTEVSGIVPQSLVELFRLLAARAEVGSGQEDEAETWSVRVGYLQVYNEQIMDLLSDSSKPLKINEDPAKGVVVVAGLAEMEVTSSEEVLNLLRQGNANRRTEATGANQVSSRSHAVLQVMVTRTLENAVSGNRSVRESKLSLIDLAGSERASATNNRGEQLRQGANINKSLLSLANCINALAGNRRRRGGKGPGNVKYRDSKLTHLLKASLEGRCRLVMIANVNPSHVFFDDSHNTLKYANRAKNIKVDPRTTESVREASRLLTDKEAKMAKDYEALKERNQLMEAQLESMRNARGYIAPEPAGFTDLFAPNTSSIMSVASSTPGYTERYGGGNGAPQQQQQQQQQLTAPAPAAAAAAAAYAGGSAKPSGGGGGGDTGRTRRSVGGEGAASGGGGGQDGNGMLPPPVPRGGRGGDRRMSEEGLASTDEEGGMVMVGSPAGVGLGRGSLSSSSFSPSSSSSPGTKRKRAAAESGGGEEEEALKAAAAAAAAAAAEREIQGLRAGLAAEKTRVCELEGKVRELESSMARMGAQHDVNMELIATFRHQKETAEEAAECERTTADELLALLKEKELEVSQLRSELDGVGSRSVGAGAAGSSVRDDATRTAADDGDSACASGGGHGAATSSFGGGSSGFRSGLMMEGDSSAFGGTLGQIEENGGGRAEYMEIKNAVAGSAGSGVLRQQQQTTGLSDRGSRDSISSGTSTTLGGASTAAASAASVDVASVIKSNRRKSSMISRSRKSMIPAPRSSGRSASSRLLGDVTNSSSTRLNDHLGSGSSSGGSSSSGCCNNPCDANKKGAVKRAASVHSSGGDGSHEMASVDFPTTGNGAAGRSKASSRRASSRTGQTPQRQTVAGRTRSRVSMAPATLRSVR